MPTLPWSTDQLKLARRHKELSCSYPPGRHPAEVQTELTVIEHTLREDLGEDAEKLLNFIDIESDVVGSLAEDPSKTRAEFISDYETFVGENNSPRIPPEQLKFLLDQHFGAADEDGIPELLPIANLPGYSVDRWGVPHRQAGPRRRAGKVKLDNRLFTKKGKPGLFHMARYRLTVDGQQKSFYPRYLMRARIHAEQEWYKKNGNSS